MTKDEALRLALEALKSNRRTHHYCEDTWYSCPKHEDGCANDSEGDECNCGADKANAGIDQAITAIKAALEAKDEPWEKFCDSNCVWTDHHPDCKFAKDEPVATIDSLEQEIYENTRQFVSLDVMEWMLKRYYTTSPQRKPMTDEEIQDLLMPVRISGDGYYLRIARAIEAAHGIKE